MNLAGLVVVHSPILSSRRTAIFPVCLRNLIFGRFYLALQWFVEFFQSSALAAFLVFNASFWGITRQVCRK
jgi:hypothetical protein